jgi:hypothetical protein
MSTLVSNALTERCFFRADGIFCAEGLLHYSQPMDHPDPNVLAYSPVTVEGEVVTCTACEGRGYFVTSEGKRILEFMSIAGRSLLRDLVDELFEEREQH